METHLLRAAAVNEDFYAKVIHAEEIIKTADTARARAEQKLSMYVSDMQNFAAFAHWLELRFNGVFKFSEIGRNWGARQRKLEHLAELVKRDSTDPVVVRLATEALEILDDITLPQRNAKE